jgi:hypothetical protein
MESKIPGQEKQTKESLDHVMLNLNRMVAEPDKELIRSMPH